MSAQPVVFIVDDDPAIRRAISRLLRAHGFRTELFDSADAFLEAAPETASGCVILDVQMPGMTGLALQESMRELDSSYPIVFISGHGGVKDGVKAMKAGAVDFLQKPFGEGELLDAVERGLRMHAEQSARLRLLRRSRERLQRLTPRETEVMELVAEGLRNQDVAEVLGISEQTVKVHRGRVMRKLKVDSVAALVRLATEREMLGERRTPLWTDRSAGHDLLGRARKA